MITNSLIVTKAQAATLNETIKQVVLGGKKGTEANLDSVTAGVYSIINWGMNLAGVLVILSVLYAAIIYLTSMGDESKAEAAKKTLLWAIVGAFFVAFAKTILWVVRGHITDVTP